MTIVLSGGSGMIGNALAASLRSDGVTLRRLVRRAPSGPDEVRWDPADRFLEPDELSGGTFTITNYGSAGTLMDTPIINQPQVAILGTGAIAKQPKVIDSPEGEVIAIRSVCYLPLTYDHRLVDGADAGRFVSAVRARLESGEFEV